MKAMRFHGPGDLRMEEVERPQIGAGEILVKPEVTLTCGTDVKMFMRGHRLVTKPVIIGHEFVGTVAEVGSQVENVQEGMRVVAANSAPCDTCFFCMRGQPNLCEHLMESLIGFSCPGAYAEYVKVPERIVQHNLFQLPDHVPSTNAALLEPLSCVVHGIEIAGISPGDNVALLGVGPIGLLHLQLARLRGAASVAVSDLNPKRLRTAQKLGADETIDPSEEDPVQRVKELFDGRGADVAIEAVGRPETWQQAVKMTRKGGRTLLFGGCPSGTQVTFDAGHIHYGELTLKGSFHHTPSSVKTAFGLIEGKQLNLEPLITGSARLGELQQALEAMARGDALKIAVYP